MQKVISINLNGNAYQLDESGYETLREYLARAERQLKDNPDRAEVMADLEQAIADKCRKYLGPHKSVVSAAEVDAIVKEMGPVDGGADRNGTAGAAGQRESAAEGEPPPKRLFRIPEGAMIAGVCTGLAAYFHIDVVIVRVAFVATALLTRGVGIMAYVIMMFVMPEASTPEERAAATGAPFNAKEVIDRAKKQAAAVAEGSRRIARQWRQQPYSWPPGVPVAYGPPPWAAVLLPVFALLQLALFLVMAAMMISLVNTGKILEWRLPPDVPLWAGALILFVAYQIAVSPLRAVQHWTWAPPGVQPAWFAFWQAVTWLLGLALVVWIGSNHIPELKEFLIRMPALIRDFAHAIRDLFSER